MAEFKKKATFPDRRKAQRIARSLKDRYGPKVGAELLGINRVYFSSVVRLQKSRNKMSHEGYIAYHAPHSIVFHIIEKAKEVML